MERIDEVLVALRRIIRATDLHSKYLVKTTGLTAPQILLLQTLRNNGESTVGELAKEMNLSQATVTSILDRLEKKNLITRERSTTDRRKVLVFLSNAALKTLKDAPLPLQEQFTRQFRDLQDWEQLRVVVMGITILRDGDREYYRVTKAWDGKETQKYVRIGRNKEKALRMAKALEESLGQRQAASKQRKKLQGEGIIHTDGRVVGLQLVNRTRAGRKPWQEFKFRVKEPDKPAKFKTVSVTAHGLKKAFQLAIERICELRDVPLNSELHKRMLGSYEQYLLDAAAIQANLIGQETQLTEERTPMRSVGDGKALLQPGDKSRQDKACRDLEEGMVAAVSEYQKSSATIRG